LRDLDEEGEGEDDDVSKKKLVPMLKSHRCWDAGRPRGIKDFGCYIDPGHK
jgi:hypothetical protein